jgi:mono/diheme cytochrome c family protein
VTGRRDVPKLRPDVTCSDCGEAVHWLAVFPGGRCVACHEVAEGQRDPVAMFEDMRAYWMTGGK